MTFKYACVVLLVFVVAQARHSRKGKFKHRDPPTNPSTTPAATTAPPTTRPPPTPATGQVDNTGKCSSLVLNYPVNQQNIPTVTVPEKKWIQTPSIVKIDECQSQRALGMESRKITDSEISASSQWDEDHAANQGRLNFKKTSRKSGCWSAEINNADQWLEVDLGKITKITRVATQGRHDYQAGGGQWVTSYQLQYRGDGVNFRSYSEEGQSTSKEFAGNTDSETVVFHDLNPPIKARYIRFVPKAWKSHISMRVELYGCTGRYQALGRVIHMDYLEQQLSGKKKLNFAATRQTMNDLVERLDILADTVYIKGTIEFFGIGSVNINAREIVGETGSKIVVSAPNWNQQFRTPTLQTGNNGDDGNHGIEGPQVDILCDVINGVVDVTSNAGDGNKGQAGANGGIGRASGHTQPTLPSYRRTGGNPPFEGYCSRQADSTALDPKNCSCDDVKGTKGIKGETGGRGGDAGRPGNGGNAGNVNIRYRKLNGQVKLKSCRGSRSPAVVNGQGGRGGTGGRGGLGRRCEGKSISDPDDQPAVSSKLHGYIGALGSSGVGRPNKIRNWGNCKNKEDEYFSCKDKGAGGENTRGDRGPNGDTGASGTTPNNRGSYGSVSDSTVQSGPLDAASKQRYSPQLLVIMRRQAEDLLLSDSDSQKGRDALQFILNVANEISGDATVDKIKNYVARKLAFLGKPGYDIFGNNKWFAPNMKWEALENTVESVKDAAETYENAFNEIIKAQVDTENFQELGTRLSEVSSLQVRAEKERLEQDKYISNTERSLYIEGIKYAEQTMNGILEDINAKIVDVYDKAKFNKADLLAVLQGLVGFYKAFKGEQKPVDIIENSISLAQSLSGKSCLKSLDSYKGSITKWLTFGENYKPYEDSSQLDFDQLDVTAIPEIMQAKLEMNKEKFAAELVCLLDVASRPQDGVAGLKALIESFFIEGAARIDLIGKVMDLDNDIGGYLFDIPLLQETEDAIANAGQGKGQGSIGTTLQQNFMDYLLSTYRALERSFMRNLYELYKAFKFRTLWEGNNPLRSFQRVASESARGTNRLNGAVQLTTVLQNMKKVQDKAVKCFTNLVYTTGIKKWYFDNVKDPKIFQRLVNEKYTRFRLGIDQSCDNCYNFRLLSTYIELFGDDSQPDTVPATVYLKVRHLSASYFRAGDKKIQQYRQPVGGYRNTKFDRLIITNKQKCRESKPTGRLSLFCLDQPQDSRWYAMCSNQLNIGGSSGTSRDRLMGMGECKSPFGTYELKIPVDENLECDDNIITNTNCKDLDLTKFTKMNVWTQFYYWTDNYPTGPDDNICRLPVLKRSHITAAVHQFPSSPEDEE